MHLENIIIISNFLDRVTDKYKDLGHVKYKWLRKYETDELNNIKIKKELLRIMISCNIDELKNKFYNIQPQRHKQNNNNVVIYCNNQNKHSINIMDVFEDCDYKLTIEIYNDDFEPFIDIFSVIVNLDDLNIFGLYHV